MKLKFSLDLRYISVALLVVILGMLVVWRPWVGIGKTDRTITVTGEASVKEKPDEYVFSPSVVVQGAASSEEATQKATDKGNAIVAKLKELGVNQDDIQTNLNAYGQSGESADSPASDVRVLPVPDDKSTAYYSITVRVRDRDLAQKIADYLVTAGVSGNITPLAQFSTEKRKNLERALKEKAIEDAKAQANTEAKLLGVRVGKVISVSDGAGKGGIEPYPILMESRDYATVPVLTGTQEFSTSITIVFAIK